MPSGPTVFLLRHAARVDHLASKLPLGMSNYRLFLAVPKLCDNNDVGYSERTYTVVECWCGVMCAGYNTSLTDDCVVDWLIFGYQPFLF